MQFERKITMNPRSFITQKKKKLWEEFVSNYSIIPWYNNTWDTIIMRGMALWDFRNNIENTIFRDTLSYSNGQPQTKGNNWLIKVIVKRNVEQPIKLFSGIFLQAVISSFAVKFSQRGQWFAKKIYILEKKWVGQKRHIDFKFSKVFMLMKTIRCFGIGLVFHWRTGLFLG